MGLLFRLHSQHRERERKSKGEREGETRGRELRKYCIEPKARSSTLALSAAATCNLEPCPLAPSPPLQCVSAAAAAVSTTSNDASEVVPASQQQSSATFCCCCCRGCLAGLQLRLPAACNSFCSSPRVHAYFLLLLFPLKAIALFTCNAMEGFLAIAVVAAVACQASWLAGWLVGWLAG